LANENNEANNIEKENEIITKNITDPNGQTPIDNENNLYLNHQENTNKKVSINALNYRKYATFAAGALLIVIIIIGIANYINAKRAEESYQEGLKILHSENGDKFTSTTTYFNKYKEDYPNSKYISRVNQLLLLISEYNDKKSELEESKKVSEYLSEVGDVFSIMENYISVTKKLHDLADKAINYKNAYAYNQVVWQMSNNYDQYKNMANDIASVSDKDASKILFASSEYNDLKRFVGNGLLPALAIMNDHFGNYVSDEDSAKVRNSWYEYEELEPKIDKMISGKKDIIASMQEKKGELQVECDDLFKGIKDSY